MLSKLWLMMAVTLCCVGCTEELFLPEGDPKAGREAFVDWGCYVCHRVSGEEFEEPTVEPPVPVVLASPTYNKGRHYLAESIIAPSHRFAKPRRSQGLGEAPFSIPNEPQEYENIKQGSQSRMVEYGDVMTIKDWVDIVAYLEARRKGE